MQDQEYQTIGIQPFGRDAITPTWLMFTNNQCIYQSPTWLPDGSGLIYAAACDGGKFAIYRGDLRWAKDAGTISISASHSETLGVGRQRVDFLASLKFGQSEVAGGAWATRGYSSGGLPGVWAIVGLPVGYDSALTLGLDNIRDVIAFHKATSATDLMCGAPSPVPADQLAEVHVRVAGVAQPSQLD